MTKTQENSEGKRLANFDYCWFRKSKVELSLIDACFIPLRPNILLLTMAAEIHPISPH